MSERDTMSASPGTGAAPSTKRPLEEESSPSGPTEQPEAKRPALEKTVEGDAATGPAPIPQVEPDTLPAAVKEEEDVKLLSNGHGEAAVDTVVPDAPSIANPLTDVPEPQPIQSTTAHLDHAKTAESAQPQGHQDESGWIHIRAVISSAEAATVIGKGGENVSQIRRLAGAKCTVSDYSRGAVERILTVSGLVDAAAKASV